MKKIKDKYKYIIGTASKNNSIGRINNNSKNIIASNNIIANQIIFIEIILKDTKAINSMIEWWVTEWDLINILDYIILNINSIIIIQTIEIDIKALYVISNKIIIIHMPIRIKNLASIINICNYKIKTM